MIHTFLMVSTSSIIMQNFWGDRATRAGCRCENMVFFTVIIFLSEAGSLFVRGGRHKF